MKNYFLSKKTLASIMSAAVLVLSTHSMTVSAVTMQEIEKQGVLNVVTEDNYAPFNFIKRGEPQGFNNDLLAEFRRYAQDKFKIEQTIMPWTGLLASVTTGQYSLAVTGSLVTQERSKVLNFSMPLAASQNVYVKKAKDNSITDIKSLTGKTVGVQSGTVFSANLYQLEEMLSETGGKLGKVIQYQSYPEAYADLANGRVDYVINSEININDLVSKRGKIFTKGQAVSKKAYFCWPVSKDSLELLTYVNGFIRHIKETGKLAELQKKWFKQSFDNLPNQSVANEQEYQRLFTSN